jgi:pimeloyl-ACP methyl ester carboxylesterase
VKQIAAGLEYDERGSGGIAVICLHGIGGNTDSFEPQLSGLSQAHRVISVNLPGYGSSAMIEPLGFAELAAKVAEFVEVVSGGEAHLVGQSIGGMIALELACSRPSVVKTLAMIATTSAFGGRDDSFKDQFIAARLKPLDEGVTIPELSARFVPEIVGPDASEAVISSAVASMSAVRPEVYREIIRCLVTFNRRTDIADLSMPCCLIAGKVDRNAPAKTMAGMAAKIPNAEYHEISVAGHLTNLEAGFETNAILTEFLAKNG